MSNMTYIPHIALLSPPSFSCPSQTDARLSAATLPQYPDSRWDRQILTLHYSRPFLNKRSHIDSWANKYRHEWVLPQLLASLHSDAASSSFFFSPIDAVLESDSSKVLVLRSLSQLCARCDGRNNAGSARCGASATDAGVLSWHAPSVAANQAAPRPPSFSLVSLR